MAAPFLDGVERIVLLRDGLKSADRAVAARAAMVAAAGAGESGRSVARRMGRTRSAVVYWTRLYLKHRDVRALAGADPSKGRAGRPLDDLDEAAPGWLAKARFGPAIGRPPRPPRGMTPEAIRAVRHLALLAADPSVRARAAIVWALERGIPLPLVAAASGRSPQAVHQLWKRWAAAPVASACPSSRHKSIQSLWSRWASAPGPLSSLGHAFRRDRAGEIGKDAEGDA